MKLLFFYYKVLCIFEFIKSIKMIHIERENYIQRIKPFINTSLIKVIIGQRRVGKSYLLYQIMDFIKEESNQSTIIYINKEDFEFDFIKDYRELIEYVNSKVNKTNKNYLLIDEIQEIQDFEKALRHFSLDSSIDIYCTGSNANLLSSELATFLSGRYIEFKVQGLTYSEFLKFNLLENSDDALKKYIKWGSLPFVKNLISNDDVIEEYLKNIFSTIIYKDVVARFQIRNISFLENLVLFLAHNTGNVISAKKISDYLKAQKINMSPQIVMNYLKYLEQANLINSCKRKELNGKKIFEIHEKFYFEDWGIRNALTGFSRIDIGKVIENIIYLHLKSKGYNVLIGVLGDKEIDFIGEKDGLKIYVQVSYLIPDDSVIEREYGNLKLIKDNFPKYVVSLDQFAPKNIDGIEHVYLRDFLLM